MAEVTQTVCIKLCERCKLAFYPACENSYCKHNDNLGKCTAPELVSICKNGLCRGYLDCCLDIWE